MKLDSHPLPIMISIAVPLRIAELKSLPPDQFRQCCWEWISRAEDEGLFSSEAVLFYVEGQSSRAFNALAQLIAAMAFVPGGITIFDQHFVAVHPRDEGQRPSAEAGGL
jgi:hypothetical protein